jgi:hypothetical protein
MRNPKSVLFLLTVAACASHKTSAPPPAEPVAAAPVPAEEPKPLEPERAQTPSERLGEATASTGARVIASLDQAIGPKFSKDGDKFTATALPGGVLPEGTKIVGRIVSIQPAMAGTTSYAVLAIQGIEERGGEMERIDARVAGVEKLEKQPGGREVGVTGAATEVIGAVIPPESLPREDAFNRDPLHKGTIIGLGSGEQPHQLDAGARLAIDLRGFTERQAVAGGRTPTGRTVNLEDVLVTDVIGDVVFWVDAKGDPTLVVLDKIIDNPETHIIVKKGQRVSVSGVYENMPSTDEAPRLWKMVSGPEADQMRGEKSYLFATKARVTSQK